MCVCFILCKFAEIAFDSRLSSALLCVGIISWKLPAYHYCSPIRRWRALCARLLQMALQLWILSYCRNIAATLSFVWGVVVLEPFSQKQHRLYRAVMKRFKGFLVNLISPHNVCLLIIDRVCTKKRIQCKWIARGVVAGVKMEDSRNNVEWLGRNWEEISRAIHQNERFLSEPAGLLPIYSKTNSFEFRYDWSSRYDHQSVRRGHRQAGREACLKLHSRNLRSRNALLGTSHYVTEFVRFSASSCACLRACVLGRSRVISIPRTRRSGSSLGAVKRQTVAVLWAISAQTQTTLFLLEIGPDPSHTD